MCLRHSIFHFLKVGFRVKANTTGTIRNTISFHYFSKGFKTNTLQVHKRYIKISELEIIISVFKF